MLKHRILKKNTESISKIIVEPVIDNHPFIKQIYPYSLNTVRVVTLKTDGNYHILGAYMRFGRGGSIVDNISQGGKSAEIDLDTGIICSAAIDKDLKDYLIHPDTGEPIIGFKIPLWKDVKAIALEACIVTPELGYLCWDLAVTTDGIALIEGNSLGGMQIQQMSLCKGKRYLYQCIL